MANSNSTTNIEEERADRFPAARAAYVVWTRQQGETLRRIKSNEKTNIGDPDQPAGESIEAKFNE